MHTLPGGHGINGRGRGGALAGVAEPLHRQRAVAELHSPHDLPQLPQHGPRRGRSSAVDPHDAVRIHLLQALTQQLRRGYRRTARLHSTRQSPQRQRASHPPTRTRPAPAACPETTHASRFGSV